MLSLVVVFVLVFVYNKLLDMFPKHQLFYIIGGFYATLFFIISLLLDHPTIGVHNTNPDPSRLLGWVSYCAIESFGSICISLFWAFVNSTINFDGAKSAFGLIIAGAQIGSILGPTLVTNAQSIGVPRLYSCGSVCMFLMVFMIYYYVKKFGLSGELSSSDGKKSKGKGAGVMEGFTLFMKYDYVKGIFAISCLFMVEVTILDYTMKVLAKHEFDQLYPNEPLVATKAFASFMGRFGQVTNLISFLFSFFGTSLVIRNLGLKLTLLAFPSLCFVCICVVFFFPSLWVVFCVMMLLKGFSYSLNNPCKEMLYQVTNTAIKFKSKSWIDTFGARGSKALGSVVTNAFAESLSGLVTYGAFVAMGVSLFLVYVARFMGVQFDQYHDTKTKVGEDDTPISDLELAKAQTNAEDTSCGLEEEGQAEEEEEAPKGKA